MPKVFYTEKDIEDMLQRGTQSLEINDDVVLTDLAYEKINRLGLKLVHAAPLNPPGSPQRPYIAQLSQKQPAGSVSGGDGRPLQGDLQERIRSAVLARMGDRVDPALLDVLIPRVLASLGVK